MNEGPIGWLNMPASAGTCGLISGPAINLSRCPDSSTDTLHQLPKKYMFILFVIVALVVFVVILVFVVVNVVFVVGVIITVSECMGHTQKKTGIATFRFKRTAGRLS